MPGNPFRPSTGASPPELIGRRSLLEAIAESIDDFGPDFDAEGNPIEEGESDRIMSEEEREKEGRTEKEEAPVGGA